MDYKELTSLELIAEIRRLEGELQESRDLLRAIQNGEIDAVVVNVGKREKIYVLDDANITYRRMIEEMNEGAVTFNANGAVLYCNKAFAGLTGYKIGDIISKPVTGFIHTKYQKWFKKKFEEELKSPIRRSVLLQSASGESIPVRVSLHKIPVSGMEVFMMTITDEREKLYIKKLNEHRATQEKLTGKLREAKDEAERAVGMLQEKNMDYTILNREYIAINNKLAKANKELLIEKRNAEKSDQLKSAFIANMSHEIRTPLNSILGYTNMLLDHIDDEEQRKHVDVIIRSGKHLLHLIDDIVDLSKLEAGEMKIVENEVSMDNLMHNISTQFEAYTVNKEKQHIEFRLGVPENNRNQYIFTDEFRVQQILSNLLSNAFKYTDEGYIEFGYKIDEGSKEVLFYVKDTGTGISDQDQKLIFKRFQQGRRPSRKVISGTGLGLAISKGLTELLGGKIWLESELGSGSCFYFTIPWKKAGPVKSPRPKSRKAVEDGIPQLEGKRILLSEDDLFSREMMLYMLKKTNAQLLVAVDGRETVDIFLENNVDLVLLDLRLPEMDGYEVLKEIRSTRPDTVVIAQTAYAMLDDIRKFKQVGFDDYLLKPVSDKDLFSMLHKYLR